LGPKNLNVSRDLTTPTFRVDLSFLARTCYDQASLSTKFAVSICISYEDIYEDMKGDTKCKKWGGLG